MVAGVLNATGAARARLPAAAGRGLCHAVAVLADGGKCNAIDVMCCRFGNALAPVRVLNLAMSL
jgi:hypothetical protein